MLEKLSAATLPLLSENIKVPKYDRSKIKPGIFHFGVGGFSRAHQALVMDNLFEQELALDWGICGISLLLHGRLVEGLMAKQDGLYTLVEKESNGDCNYRVIGSIVECISAKTSSENVIERLAEPECRIVSLTITGTGYNMNPATKEFDLTKEDIKDDINNPEQPKTVFGIVAEALRRRKERGMKGFTIMSCDNLQGNGDIAKEAFTSYAKVVNLELALWMDENVTFPNSMVDRITPTTTDADRRTTSEKLGVVDEYPVVCEPYIQWILEDKFVDGRPPFEKFSDGPCKEPKVQLVNDVRPYELMKMRLLNAGHQAITYFGLLMNYKHVHEAATDELILKFLEAYMEAEATSTLKPVRIDLDDYKNKIVQRFQNQHVSDTLARLASKGSDRIFRFVMPVIADRLAEDQSIWFSTAIVASFVFHLSHLIETCRTDDIACESRDELVSLSTRLLEKNSSRAIAKEENFFGEIVKNEKFVETFEEIFEKMRDDGPKVALGWLLGKLKVAEMDSLFRFKQSCQVI